MPPETVFDARYPAAPAFDAHYPGAMTFDARYPAAMTFDAVVGDATQAADGWALDFSDPARGGLIALIFEDF